MKSCTLHSLLSIIYFVRIAVIICFSIPVHQLMDVIENSCEKILELAFSEMFIIETIYHKCVKTIMPLMISFDSYNIIKISTEYVFICSYCSSSYCLISIILVLQYFACSLLLGILNNNHIYIFHSGIWLIYFIAIFFNKKNSYSQNFEV